MSREELLRALRRLSVETGSLACLGCGYEHNCSIHGCAVILEAVEALEELPNDPLTPEKLREMGKDWVWIELKVPLYGMSSGWHVNHPRFSDEDKFCCGYPSVVMRDLPYSGYGDTWLAYRRKPEEDAHGT